MAEYWINRNNNFLLLFFLCIYTSYAFYIPTYGSAPGTNCWETECFNEVQIGLFEGDIYIPERGIRNAINDKSHYWPGGVIPYVFTDDVDDRVRNKVVQAMKGLEMNTCLHFLPKTQANDTYISINTTEKGCFAQIGFKPPPYKGKIIINLHKPGCVYRGTIQHELLHIVGLYHEQSRPDRDLYVKILWNNIVPRHKKNFKKLSHLTTFNLDYDYKSLMHYSNKAFSKNGRDTIESLENSSMKLGQRIAPTRNDLEKVRKMYCHQTS